MPKPGEHNHKMNLFFFLCFFFLHARWGVVFPPADVYKTDINPQSNQNNFWPDPNQTLIAVIILNGVKMI